jgi:hypothetical protein
MQLITLFRPNSQILLQVQAVSSPPNQQYRGLWDALKRIPKQEGGWKVRPHAGPLKRMK